MVEVRQGRRAEALGAKPGARRPALGELEFWCWTGFLFFSTQPFFQILFSLGLSGADSPYIIWLRTAASLGLVAYLYNTRNVALPLIKQAWPYWLFLILTGLFLITAVDSRFSSVGFFYSFNNLIPIVALCCRLPTKSFMRSLIYVFAASVILSLLTAVLLPRYGVMHGADPDGTNNAGNWCGIYSTKNVMGHVIGFYFPILLYFGRRYLGLVAWVITMLAAVVCLIKANSSSGLVIAAVLSGLYFLIIKPTGRLRVVLICIFAAASGWIVVFRAVIVDSILGMLGKSADLSGRTDIWRVMSDLVFERPLTGFGFQYTGSKEMGDLILRDFNVVSVHNAYLDNFICLGIPLTILLLCALGYPMIRAWMRPAPEILGDLRSAGTLLAIGGAISGFSEAAAAKISEVNLMVLCGVFMLYKVCTIQKGIDIHKKASWNKKVRSDIAGMRDLKTHPAH